MKNLYPNESYRRAVVTQAEEVLTIKKRTAICCSENIFYPGGGGQPEDLGTIEIRQGEPVKVVRILKQSGRVFACLDSHDEVSTTDPITARIDWERRYRYMRYHTAAHIVMGSLRRTVEGYAPEGIAIQEDAKSCLLKFGGSWVNTRRMAEQVMIAANAIVAEGRTVTAEEYEALAAAKTRYPQIYRGSESLDGAVRLVVIADWDANPCGGTHVSSTSEVGGIRLQGHDANQLNFEIDLVGPLCTAD